MHPSAPFRASSPDRHRPRHFRHRNPSRGPHCDSALAASGPSPAQYSPGTADSNSIPSPSAGRDLCTSDERGPPLSPDPNMYLRSGHSPVSQLQPPPEPTPRAMPSPGSSHSLNCQTGAATDREGRLLSSDGRRVLDYAAEERARACAVAVLQLPAPEQRALQEWMACAPPCMQVRPCSGRSPRPWLCSSTFVEDIFEEREMLPPPVGGW